MSIPESQLHVWSSLGAQTGSAATYHAIQRALHAHSWPDGMLYDTYLQGSYANWTNIRGDSDVDIAVETTSTFYHDVPADLTTHYGLTTPARYSWTTFRAHIKKALIAYFGTDSVQDRNKCLTVRGYGNRLTADVVPCATYHRYAGVGDYASGMTFWTKDNKQIINFPKIHRTNGVSKNDMCGDRYKPTIRVIKNARNRAANGFPSYFVECLLYNVPNSRYTNQFGQTFQNILAFLVNATTNRTIVDFPCQHGQHKMCGLDSTQTTVAAVAQLLLDLDDLWQRWT